MNVRTRFLVWLMLFAAPAWLALAWLPTQLNAQAPDMILHNGKVLTVDNNFTTVQAVSISGNKFTMTGTNEAVLATAGPNTQKIDLKGRTVTPGLVDTHRHMYAYSEGAYGGYHTSEELRRFPVDWTGVRTKQDVLNQVSNLMARYKFKPGEWIYMVNGVSFMSNDASPIALAQILYDDLNADDLAKITPDNPVLMSMGIPDFNGFLLNRKALDWVMTNHGDYVRKNGRFWIGSNGQPDGHLEPPASRIVLPFTYERSAVVLGEIYKRDMAEAASMGLTSIATRMPKDALAAYRKLESDGKLTYRIGYGVIEAFGNTDLDKQDLKSLAAQVGKGTEKIWMTGAGPTAIDGASSRQCTNQKRTGTFTPIDGWFPTGQCHTDIEYRGAAKRAAPIQKNYFGDWIMASGRDGVRFANTHVAGDRANASMISFMEKLQAQYGKDSTKNWALDHCGMVDPKDFARMGKVGVTVSCYVMLSVNGASNMERAYGTQVANTFPSPLNSMLKAGVKVVLESDSGSFLWEDIRTAVTRKDRAGKVWGPQDKVDRPTALRMITRWAGDYFLRGEQIGSIEKGKSADLVILDKDYMTIPEDDIGSIRPLATVFDGKIIFVQPSFSTEYNLKPAGALVTTYEDLVKTRKPRSGASTGG